MSLPAGERPAMAGIAPGNPLHSHRPWRSDGWAGNTLHGRSLAVLVRKSSIAIPGETSVVLLGTGPAVCWPGVRPEQGPPDLVLYRPHPPRGRRNQQLNASQRCNPVEISGDTSGSVPDFCNVKSPPSYRRLVNPRPPCLHCVSYEQRHGYHMTEAIYTANHWGTYRVERDHGRLIALHGLDSDPAPSPIGQSAIDTLDHACRIPQPMVRRGYLENGPEGGGERRGAEPFVAVSWDEAERLVATELDRVRQEHGNQAIFAGSYGWASAGKFHHGSSQLHRFPNCIGGFTRSVNTYSLAAGEVILPHVLGPLFRLLPRHTSWKSIAKHTELMVAFGGLPTKNAQIGMGGNTRHVQARDMRYAHRQGVRFVNVSPMRSDAITELEADWLALRPNTDVALMLGLAHTLVAEGLHDREFLSRYCVGFEQFRCYLMGETDDVAKSAEWASEITEIDAMAIQSLARKIANRRTMISLSWSLTRQDHGEQPFWMGTVLAAMLGQIGLPGGGVGFGYSAVNNVGQHSAHLPWASLDRGTNPVKTFIPVARIADLLLNPGAIFDFNGEQHVYPDVRLVYWVGGNPFHHHQDLNRLITAWRRPESIIVHELWWNALARHSDIVLPATTPLERDDIVASPRMGFAVASRKALEPFAETRDDYLTFSALAKRLGVGEAFTEGRDALDWIRHLYDVSRQHASAEGHELPGFDEFWSKGVLELPEPDASPALLGSFRENPVENRLSTPSGRIEIFSAAIEGFRYDDCPPHPAWMEPIEWLGHQKAGRYPLHLISNQPKTRLHSQLDHGSHSRAHKVQEREVVTIHPDDAEPRGIKNGDLVRLFNERGSCLAAAAVSETIRPGVVQIPTGAWYDPEQPGQVGSECKHGNPNVLTLDKGTSKLAQGPIAHSCLVEIERADQPPPTVTAFVPPKVIKRK